MYWLIGNERSLKFDQVFQLFFYKDLIDFSIFFAVRISDEIKRIICRTNFILFIRSVVYFIFLLIYFELSLIWQNEREIYQGKKKKKDWKRGMRSMAVVKLQLHSSMMYSSIRIN